MSETAQNSPVDVTTLGPHIGNAITQHVAQHESQVKDAETKQFRQKKLSDFLEKIDCLAGDKDITAESLEAPYEIITLDTGTKISAILGVVGNQLGISHAQEVAKGFHPTGVGIDPSDGDVYIEGGAISSKSRRTVDLHEGVIHSLVQNGMLSLSLTFNTSDPGGINTSHDAFVGIIVDPETIFVPEQDETSAGIQDASTMNTSLAGLAIIGPDDGRFEPIMQTLQHVNDGIKQANQPH